MMAIPMNTWVSAPAAAGAKPQRNDDHALALQAAQGDTRAFEALYRAHADRVYGLCWRLCNGDEAKASQYAQDAFVRAWEKIASFRGDSLFSTWMHRLTVNVVLGDSRLLRRWVTFEDAISEDEPGEMLSEHPQQHLGDHMDLERALVKLPPGARTVLILHDVEGYRHDEIAQLTGIAVGTSKAQLHRARKLMKEWLQ